MNARQLAEKPENSASMEGDTPTVVGADGAVDVEAADVSGGESADDVGESRETIGDTTDAVNEDHFEEIVSAALGGVGGTLLFKMRVVTEAGTEHVAAGSVGDGASRYFLILSMPTAGGELRVEEAAKSKNPVARIAASYAGLADALSAAA